MRNCGRDAEHQAPADKPAASCREAADDDVDAQTLFDVPDAREGVADYTLEGVAHDTPEGVAHDTPIYPSVEPSESLSSSTEHDTPRARGGPRATTTTTIGLSSDFEVPEAWRAWAIEHFYGLEVEQEAHGFVNYNLARGTKAADWFAMWKRWIGKCKNARPHAQHVHQAAAGPIGPPEWLEFCEAFKALVRRTFSSWIKPLVVVEWSDERAVLSAPGSYARDRIVSNHLDAIRAALNRDVEIVPGTSQRSPP